IEREREGVGDRERRRGEHRRLARLDEAAPDRAPQVRRRDAKRDVAVTTALEPHDVAIARLMDAARDRDAHAGELAERRRELGLLILVRRARREAFRGRGDPGDGISETLARELD